MRILRVVGLMALFAVWMTPHVIIGVNAQRRQATVEWLERSTCAELRAASGIKGPCGYARPEFRCPVTVFGRVGAEHISGGTGGAVTYSTFVVGPAITIPAGAQSGGTPPPTACEMRARKLDAERFEALKRVALLRGALAKLRRTTGHITDGKWYAPTGSNDEQLIDLYDITDSALDADDRLAGVK